MPPFGFANSHIPEYILLPDDIPDTPAGRREHEVLISLHGALEGPRWDVGGDSWRYLHEARHWHGVGLVGGEAARLPEEVLFRNQDPDQDEPPPKVLW